MRYFSMMLGAVALGSMFVVGCSGSGSDEPTASADQRVTEGADTQIDQWCGGSGWVSTSSFQAIAGSYARTGSAAKGTLATITFSETSSPDHFHVGGSFAATFEGGETQAGAFSSLPDNAAFSSNILLDPTGAIATGAPSSSSAMYYTLGMKVAPSGDISALCVEHMLNATTAEPVIVLERSDASARKN